MIRKFLLPAAVAIAVTSCGGQKGQTVDSDSIHEPETVESEPVATEEILLTSEGVGIIAIGMPMSEIPDSVPGLYTSKENGASPDAVTVTFSNPDGQQFVAYDFGEGNVDVINVIGNDVKVQGVRETLDFSSPFSKVLELPGVEAEWTGYDDGGMWYWKWHGLWFAPTQENLSTDLSHRLYHSGQAPTFKDFTEDVKIGFIGTGLPF